METTALWFLLTLPLGGSSSDPLTLSAVVLVELLVDTGRPQRLHR